MSVVYVLVARGTTVLAEYTVTTGNFQQVTRLILEKVPTGDDQKAAFAYDDHVFHILVHRGFVFLAMCGQDFKRKLAFAMLDEIKNKFMLQFAEEGRTAVAYSLTRQFNKVLKDQLDYFTQNPELDKTAKVRNEIEDVKGIMVENIDRILERGEKIELLVDKAEQMNEQAVKFRTVSRQLKQRMWWQNCKLIGIIVLITCIIVLIIVLSLKPWEKK
eukprot:CAMPEP_0175811836 /NCGR_PEP_ID=MMETSP0107_2-20121207/4056_1 /TAXON_ID=195067 ORGANISM="Goniomonas pacifica, Strain CCMP1869" /NCGR_SAMPLE_ID=MMETSP0107_2 /ASSEMBLY_ACC=CAM_ASM_000203 /LENGTH=215 /DNA_ID=CAMNT_0017123659 /DNA_START=12 /DNA_END=659 /DNA_ORIENTATION=-